MFEVDNITELLVGVKNDLIGQAGRNKNIARHFTDFNYLFRRAGI